MNEFTRINTWMELFINFSVFGAGGYEVSSSNLIWLFKHSQHKNLKKLERLYLLPSGKHIVNLGKFTTAFISKILYSLIYFNIYNIYTRLSFKKTTAKFII